MKIFDLISMCVRNLIRRKFRTFLTVTGVVIGTTSIVMMISLGIGMSTQLDEQIKMWGDLTMINVYYGGSTTDTELTLDDEAVEKISQIPGVDVATPFFRLQMNSEISMLGGKGYRYINRYPEIYGIYPEALEKMGYKIDKGEPLPTGKTKTLQVVFGGTTAYRFEDSRKKTNNMRSNWPDENGNIEEPFFDPLKTEFKLVLPPADADSTTAKKLEFEFEVKGLLVSESNKWETRYSIFMPLEEIKRLQTDFNKENSIKTPRNHKTNYDDVRVKALDMDSVPDIEQAIKDMGFGTSSMESMRQEMQKSMQQMQIILGALGGISLLVSAISITNTMIMSVYERTREIGVMKVLGCLVGNIRSIFLIEAGFIGFFGGIFGVGFSFLLSFALNTFGGAISGGGMGMGMLGMFGNGGTNISVIPLWLVLLGLAFATGIGLVSGFYPANRAVKISALEAIKQE